MTITPNSMDSTSHSRFFVYNHKIQGEMKKDNNSHHSHVKNSYSNHPVASISNNLSSNNRTFSTFSWRVLTIITSIENINITKFFSLLGIMYSLSGTLLFSHGSGDPLQLFSYAAKFFFKILINRLAFVHFKREKRKGLFYWYGFLDYTY